MNDFRPPDDTGQLRRTLIAFALVFAVIVLMRFIMPAPQPPAPVPSQPVQNQPTPPAPATAAATPPAATKKSRNAPANTSVPESHVAAAEQETVVENDLYRIKLSNRGAQVTSWVLKQYRDDKGNLLELIHPIAAPKYGYPLSLWTYDEGLRNKLASTLYVTTSRDTNEGAERNERTITLEFSDGGIAARKVLTFDLRPSTGGADGNRYCVKVETLVTQNGAPVAAFPAWPAGFGDQTVAGSYAVALDIWRNQDKVERIVEKSVSGGATIQPPLQWAGTEDQYFAAAFLPDNPADAALVTLHNGIQIPKNLDKPDPNQMVSVDVLGAAVGNRNGATSGRLFVGPKALDILNTVHAVPAAGQNQGPDLEPVLDFGKYFGWLAKPLFIWLQWTHDHWHVNWGWSIVLLTIIINAALLPLRLTSMKSMMRMQKIQPQMKAIQERYKKYSVKDPKRAEMQKELSELYKKEGVNPAGGCVPLLLQWPFLVAFYSMLGVAIELRHAPWIWIKDLASPDPYYILSLLVVISMFWVQKMSPQTGGDPMQQKMMLFGMPLVIGWLSHAMASGLAIYWVWSNLVMILQQYAMNRTAFGQEMRAMALKRAVSKPRR